jgi:hypothetical protein
MWPLKLAHVAYVLFYWIPLYYASELLSLFKVYKANEIRDRCSTDKTSFVHSTVVFKVLANYDQSMILPRINNEMFIIL